MSLFRKNPNHGQEIEETREVKDPRRHGRQDPQAGSALRTLSPSRMRKMDQNGVFEDLGSALKLEPEAALAAIQADANKRFRLFQESGDLDRFLRATMAKLRGNGSIGQPAGPSGFPNLFTP